MSSSSFTEDHSRVFPSLACSRPFSIASTDSWSCSTSIVSFIPSYSCREISTVSVGIHSAEGLELNKTVEDREADPL